MTDSHDNDDVAVVAGIRPVEVTVYLNRPGTRLGTAARGILTDADAASIRLETHEVTQHPDGAHRVDRAYRIPWSNIDFVEEHEPFAETVDVVAGPVTITQAATAADGVVRAANSNRGGRR